ncbi:UNVERIFIED_CONTAM: hypothetical protein PYX00_000588 [Menopon gallinae]|uniref:Tafazzin family protein n=1 Tax=Menopon gallinae TaxID=328185 RepID=A0AAW2I9N6_9NEOP
MYNIDWIIPKLRSPKGRLWNLASTITLAAVGLFSKIVIVWFNKTRIHNKHILYDAIEKRQKDVPLITISNHHSCFDDPGIWGVLKVKHLLNREKMRWSLAAHDICFTNKFHSYFFLLGKCIPIIRGKGVYQKYMDFCVDLLKKGQWLHLFPEGRVNMEKNFLRFKWGVGRLIYELPVLPVIIPIWHIGMDYVLPNYPPYVLKYGNKVTLNFGKPIDLSDVVAGLRKEKVTDEEARKAITDRIQDELMKLKRDTEALHEAYLLKNS